MGSTGASRPPAETGRKAASDPRLARRAVKIQMAGMGLEFAASILCGAALGYYLDDWLGTEPFLLIVCILVGLFSSMARLLTLTRRLQRLRRTNDEGAS